MTIIRLGRGVVMSIVANRQFIVWAFCLLLFLTFGVRLLTQIHTAEASPEPISEPKMNPHITAFLKGYLVSFKPSQASLPSAPIEQPQLQPPAMEKNAVLVPAQNAMPAYEVTAYFLNVRSNPNASSPIVRVVEQGTVLEAIRMTEEGWLELSDGGYVHGRYVKIVSPEAEKQTIALASAAFVPSRTVAIDTVAEPSMPKAAAKPSKPTSKVNSASGLTKAHIEQIFEGTELADDGLEEAVLEIEEEYGINAYFTIAVMKLESGNGKSSLARDKNNLFGLNATGGGNQKAFSFKTKGDSVRKFGQLLDDYYVGKGYTTIEKVAQKYCPANPKWASLVSGIMKSDYNKL
jgi:hypothetical protein